MGFIERVEHYGYSTFDLYNNKKTNVLIDLQFDDTDQWVNFINDGKRVCVKVKGKYVDYKLSNIIATGNLTSDNGKIEATSISKCQ